MAEHDNRPTEVGMQGAKREPRRRAAGPISRRLTAGLLAVVSCFAARVVLVDTGLAARMSPGWMTGIMVVLFFFSWDQFMKGRSVPTERLTAEQSDTAPVGERAQNSERQITLGRKSRLRPLLALLLVTVGLATWILVKTLPPRRPLPTPIVNEEYGFRLVLERGWSAMAPARAPGGNSVRIGVNIDPDINGFLDIVPASTSLDELTATVRGHLALSDPTTEPPRQVLFLGQRAVEYSSVTSNAQGGHTRFRSMMFLHGPYLYTLAAGGDPELLTAARAQSFFHAFQFTEPKLASPSSAR